MSRLCWAWGCKLPAHGDVGHYYGPKPRTLEQEANHEKHLESLVDEPSRTLDFVDRRSDAQYENDWMDRQR